MNQAEFEALSENCLPPFAVTLYIRCFRKNMNFSDGLVYVSQRFMRDAMEHTPPRGSNKCFGAPSRETLRTAIRQLRRVGLIELVEKGDIREQKATLFYCRLASVEKVRQNEEQPQNNHRTTTTPNTTQATTHKRYGGNVVKFHKTDEQPIPEKPIEDEETACARENLTFNDSWIALARQAGYFNSAEELCSLFNKWKLSDNDNVYRHIAMHRKYWMRYCAAIKHNQVKGGNHALNQSAGQSSGYRNAAAIAWRDSYERAQRGEGVEEFDFAEDQT